MSKAKTSIKFGDSRYYNTCSYCDKRLTETYLGNPPDKWVPETHSILDCLKYLAERVSVLEGDGRYV